MLSIQAFERKEIEHLEQKVTSNSFAAFGHTYLFQTYNLVNLHMLSSQKRKIHRKSTLSSMVVTSTICLIWHPNVLK